VESSVSEYIGKAVFRLKKLGSPTGNAWAELWTITGGNPNSKVATSTTYLDISTISADALGAEYEFEFDPTAYEMTATENYSIILNGDWAQSTDDRILLMWHSSADGTLDYYASGMWQTYTDRQFYYEEYYITPSGTPPTPTTTISTSTWTSQDIKIINTCAILGVILLCADFLRRLFAKRKV